MDARALAIAMRCQLVTGSYNGASRSCPCHSPNDRQLTVQQRVAAMNEVPVMMATERNLTEWNSTSVHETAAK